MKVPLLDLKAQYTSIKDEVDVAINSVIDSQYFIMGPTVKNFERNVSDYCQAEFAFGCASGSDALLLALMAIDIQPDEYVITTPFTFFATSGAISRLGATPIFVDIDPDTYNIDPKKIRELLEGNHPILEKQNIQLEKIRAIIPVHLYGQMADMKEISRIAAKYGMVVIEDAAQSIGATLDGIKAGNYGDFSCFSFFPSKNLGAYGDAGLITVKNAELAEKVDILRLHGARPKYHNKYVGLNSRLDAIQAAVLDIKLKYLDDWSTSRREKALRYNQLFQEIGKTQEFSVCENNCIHLGDDKCSISKDKVVLPKEVDSDPLVGGRHIYHQYTIRVRNRDFVSAKLKERGIGSAVYYPVPMHVQECYRELGYRMEDLPIAVCASKQVLSLPIYPEITEEQQIYVVEMLNKILNGNI